ncbi:MULTISPECIES: type II secretion system inner membrane protein GspF [Salinivibrio]|uniref:Type II secretion system protein GspF n=1 Tax=Salinivibrio costicola subsp. alcaliphilus TaxID=272773 RepID=A0ABX3KQ24_SALCS|nr:MULTISPECIES: type II secretion system inner membrane protein GspF [Salinivibrio]OOE89114.1 type II secretion system protein GspF [Salinivibrio sp. AR640]OOF05109.1 type II secretion system protein GspF [Salinivibrio sp. MA607]OOF33534.1 type II secretion system protein GspF [Salinivibrio costicola subsp. alcaliphilus]
MGAFDYQALDARGRKRKGVIEADTARQARQQLRDKGFTPLDVNATRRQRANQKASASQPLFSQRNRGIRTQELSLITRQLATLIDASMPLEECLKAVAEQAEKPRIGSMMTSVRARVMEGYTLADALADYPQVFNELYRAMIAAGEKAGYLSTVLSRLADYVENRQRIQSTLLQAMLYPAILTFFSVVIVAFLLATVVPDIVGQFVQTGQALPASTQFLLNASDFITDWGVWVVSALILIGVSIRALLKDTQRRLVWDKKILSLPVIGRVARGLNTSRFARTLAICTASAIPLLDGMKVAAQVMSNQYVRMRVLEAADKVREGASLRVALDQSRLFPPMMLHMIASGERSGDLEPMLSRAADNQDKDFEAQVNVALGIFGPLMIVLMAGLVLFIVVATLMPIIAMNDMVGL